MLELDTMQLLLTLERTLPPAAAFPPVPLRESIPQVTWLGFPDSHTTAEVSLADALKASGSSRAETSWYGFRGVGASVEVTAAGSDSDIFLTVFADYGTGLSFVCCGDGSRGQDACCEFFAIRDVSYYFRAQGFAGPWGRLTIATGEPAPYPARPFRFDFAIDPAGSVNARNGLVSLTGKLDPSAPAKFSIDVTLSQSVGDLEIHAYGVASFERAASGLDAWNIRLRAWDGFFVPGVAFVSAYAEGCGSGLRDFWSELIEPFPIELREST